MAKPEDRYNGHRTRISDASSFDEICIYCGAHDEIGSMGDLARPCPKTEKEKAKMDKEYDNV